MKDAGSALMGIGRATGESRAVEAARQAIASPLLEVDIAGAQGILFNVTGSSSLSLFEVTEAAEEIRSAADPEANIIFGTSFNERLGEEVAITVIATGFDGKKHTASSRANAGAASDVAARAPRDFLEELERQRSQMSETGVPDAPAARAEEGANGNGARIVEPVGVRRPTYDADDLEIPSFLRRSR
jgi:cell division GTPase FtsZ